MRARASSRRGCCALVVAKKARRSGGYQRRAHSSKGCGIGSWGRSASESGRLCRGPIVSRARAQGRGGRRRRVPVLPILSRWRPATPPRRRGRPGRGRRRSSAYARRARSSGVGGHGAVPRFPTLSGNISQRVLEVCHPRDARHRLLEELESLRGYLQSARHARHVAAGTSQAGHRASLHGIRHARKDDGQGLRGPLRGQRGRGAAGDDHVHRRAHQFGREDLQAFDLTAACPAQSIAMV